jgi:tight adherence protein C
VLFFFATACFLFALAFAGRAMLAPAVQQKATFRRARAHGTSSGEADAGGATNAVWSRLAELGERLSPRVLRESVELRIVEAGLAGRFAPADFFAVKMLLAGLGLAAGALIGSDGVARLVIPLLLAAAGLMLPDALLALRRRRRRDEILRDLPDALDLLAVSVEAGLGFEGAVAKLVEHLDGPVADEFEFVLAEMRTGVARHDALKRLAERVDATEIASFVSGVVHAEQLGSSMAQLLRVHASDARRRHQARAEERASRAPVKMLFPTALLIFPAMFIVILGPAFIKLAQML